MREIKFFLNFFTPSLQNDLQHHLPLSLLARSILVVLCNMEAAMKAVSLKKWGSKVGVLFPLGSWRPLIPQRWKKQLSNRFECQNWYFKMHAFSIVKRLPRANRGNFEASAVCFEVIVKRLCSSYRNVVLTKSTLNASIFWEIFQIFKMTSIAASKQPLFGRTGT